MARLSVIIPGYNNRPEWWRRCINSAKAACGPEDEIICVDDGSAEPVRQEWVDSDADSRVRLYRKENGGLASARNFGMGQMNGKYVTFVDSDDAVRKEAFARCVAVLEDTGADIAVYGVEVIWEEEKLHRIDVPEGRYYGTLSAANVEALREARLLNYACNKVYRVAFLKGTVRKDRTEITFNPKGMPCEDIIFNLDCIVAGAKWVTVNYPGYRYYHRINGTLVSNYKPHNLDGVKACADAWRRYTEALNEQEREIFHKLAFPSDGFYLEREWKNIWAQGSPYTFCMRWDWLKQHPELGGVGTFLKMALFVIARRYMYFTIVRRWHIRRISTTTEDYDGIDNV